MWEGKDPDPGGTGNTAPSPHQLSDLKDQNEQQLLLIAQLKEMLRKEQSTVSQDKVEEYVNTLTRARAKRSKQKKGDSSSSSTTSSVNIDANKKERVNLLRQQLEENKARLAERGKSQRGIEEMVTQLQAQLKDTQSLTPLNVSFVEPKTVDYNESTPQKELYKILLTKEKKITELLSKSQKLEASVLDLQENLKEKDSVIEARTKAITLMTDSLSKKGKNTLDVLEETKEQMRKMQENFVTLEAEMKARQLTLLNDLKVKKFEISELEREKSELEQQLLDRPSLQVESSDVDELKTKISQLQLENATSIEDLQNKLSELTKDNAGKMKQISDLELQLKDALANIPKDSVDSLQSVAVNLHQGLAEENSKHLLRIEELEQMVSKLQEIGDSVNSYQSETVNLEENSKNLSRIKELEQMVLKLQEAVDSSSNHQIEIDRLLEDNDRLSKDKADHLSRMQELESQLEGALTDLKLLKNTGMGGATKTDKDENEEIAKLKKQLDESNKSMIKMRAVQKGKIKELNKKLDQFRKMNDANALIVQLQNENSKLNEKIAELEDEKGNLQLKMVDSSTSSKDDTADLEEELKKLKEKLSKAEQELDEKEKVIEILESEVINLKADLKQKDEEEIKVSTQVSSQMSSICYEEQIETLETEKRKLLGQLEALNVEKENLKRELELVKKEKQEINVKLNSYIQENMDLIDKLEKLSAEKVSSAESIEIVEGLTQQEKLELAAYQKHINPEETLKCADEDSIEPPVELNESVLQLSEDTAELLQKIEMFTQERKEVMQKMEALKEENTTLCLKVKEIENNRDVLEETYEQLQNEKDVLVNEKEELSNQLATLQTSQTTEKVQDQSADLLDSTLKDLQIKYETLIQENDQLKHTLKQFDSIVQEKHDLENRLREIMENNASLDMKLNSNLDEINTYQLTIEENKAELINSAETINKLHDQLEDRENDIQELHININELNSVVGELQGKQGSFEEMESELDQLKTSLTGQITQAGDYETEIAVNSQTIKQLNDQLVGVNRKMLELENELELKDGEVEKLLKDISNKDAIIKRLQTNIEEKDNKFKTVSEDMKVKYLELKKQLDNNDEILQQQILDLTGKNKEQLEKMKKIAANLKKKSQAYQELEERFNSAGEKWEVESKEKDANIEDLMAKVVSVTIALGTAEDRLRMSMERVALVENELVSLKDQTEVLEQTNADQQHYIQELKHKKLQETSLQQEMSASLHEEMDNSSFSRPVPDDKIRELELLLETNEAELNHFKERVDRLQLDIRQLQESKSQLEAANVELEEKLSLTSNSFKEKALLEDQLELRLAEVTANDEALSKKLQEIQTERDELLKKSLEHEELIKRLKIKLKKAHDKVTELKAAQVSLQELDAANRELRSQVAALEDNQRHIQSENESLQRRNMSDYEKIEADYMVQLEELLKTKGELTTENERALERIKELEESQEELSLELNEYKEGMAEAKLVKDQLEEMLKVKVQLIATNEKALERIKELEAHQEELSLELSQQVAEAKLLKGQLEELVKIKGELTAANEKALERIKELEVCENELLLELNEYKEGVAEAKLHQIQLQESTDDAGKLRKELDDVKVQITFYKERYVAVESFLENQAEFDSPQQILERFKQLNEEVDRLNSDMAALEFAIASLEASCVSSQKLDIQPTEVVAAISSFHTGRPSLILKRVEEPIDNSDTSNEVLQTEVATLKNELVKLNEEIRALQFAKSSLEASLESSQKPSEAPINQPVLEEYPKIIIPPEQVPKEHPQVQSAAIPIFNAFAQPAPSNSVFDQWFNQPVLDDQFFNVVQNNELVQVPPEAEVSLSSAEVLAEAVQLPSTFPSSVVEDGREALLKKIKALEFLLYNVDKEKEIALEQCTEMVNELTQIVYAQTQPSSSNIESQILPPEAIALDRTSLQATEYTPTNPNYGEHPLPVEEICAPKKAYLCYDNEPKPAASTSGLDSDEPKPAASTSGLDSQVVSEKDIAEAASKKHLQKLEYEPVGKIIGEQQLPVVETLAQPKHAYLCFAKDDKEAFEENDDGWGWGPEEARLEEEHMSTVENTPQVKSLMLEVQQLKETIRVLQMERDNHLEEIKQLQIKSGKLIKKCKELKARSEQVGSKKDEPGFFDLNETIQEELKGQVQQLEKKLKELQSEFEKEKAEKGNLLKRVDVLTAANDRMTEMKEIQDSEVLRWQRKHQEALQKIQEYEWGSDGFGEVQKQVTNTTLPSADHSSKINELEATIKELNLDNEELQTLLETERSRRLEAEKNKNGASENELAELRSINQNLHEQLDKISLKSNELQLEMAQVITEKNEISQQKLQLEATLQELQRQVASLSQTNLLEKDVIIEELQGNLEQLTTRKVELDHTVAQLRQELNTKTIELQSALDQTTISNLEADNLRLQIVELTEAIQAHELIITNLNKKQATNAAEKQQRDEEYNSILQQLQAKTSELQQCQQIVEDLQSRIKEIETFGANKTALELENQSLTQQLEEKQLLLDTLQVKTSYSNKVDIDAKTKEIEELTAEKLAREVEIQRLMADVQSKEQEFQERVETLQKDLNEAWQLQVDQRGADVAESWKLHLEIVEKDFASVQEKFKLDLTEMEERCNILMNENNELRKNVDQEIRNEVDKMPGLQQQISGLQQTITALNEALLEKDKRIEEIQNNLANYLSLESELQTLKAQNLENEHKLAGVNIIIDTTQKQFDEKRLVVEEIVSALEKQAQQPISYEKDDILREFQRQLALGGNKDGEISRLNQLVQELEEKLDRVSGEKSREITGLNQVIEDLEKELIVVHEKESEIIRLEAELEEVQKAKALISLEKEHLAVELDKVKQQHANCTAIIDSCNCQVQEYYNAQLALQQSLDAKMKELDNLNQQLLQIQTDAKNDGNKEMEMLSGSLEKAKQDYQVLQQSLSECQSSLHETQRQLAIQIQESQTTNENILQYSQKYNSCEQEVNTLKENVLRLENDKKEIEGTLQRHYAELLSNKEIDIGTLKNQVQELINVNEAYGVRLNQELAAKQWLEQQLNEQTQLVNEDTKQLEELKLIIEDQVTKIEDLKKELFNKSNQYDSLIAEMDVGRPPVTQQPLAAAVSSSSTDEDSSEPVSRAELDLALYMWHQRDVRCEELTVEVTHLLEERDTLQLRLSNALREKEELRRSITAGNSSSSGINTESSKSSAIFLAASGTELAKDPLENEHNLATKLSELKTVGYKKDKTFVDEQETRRLQQLAIMQQHINDASKLPPEAAAKLVDASYTLSRDVQSPSKVLLNWLWGKNPPKANDS